MRVALKDSKEKAAMYLGWIGFAVVIIGLFVPWGTYEQFSFGQFEGRTIFVSGFATNYGFLLIIAALAIIVGLLGSMIKPSGVSIAFLGTGAMATILIVGWFLTTYYPQRLYYSEIEDLSIGSFVTVIGGVAALASAILYSLHLRAPTSEEKTQTNTPPL